MGYKMKNITNFIGLIIITASFSIAWSEESTNDENEQNSLQEVKERKYVTDKLRLSLYKKPNANAGTLKLLTSGDVLDVLERSGPYSKVTTVENETGWVKNGFLVSIPPASFLLIEEKKNNEKLTQQLEKLSNTKKIIADYENTIQKMNADTSAFSAEYNTIRIELDDVIEKNIGLKQQLEKQIQQNDQFDWLDMIRYLQLFWYVVLSIVIILFLAGLSIGKAIVQAKVRKRFQGVKVL